MNGWLQQLIDLSGDYDYAWFIAGLAWCAVAVGAWGRGDRRESWLIWLTGANIVGAVLELALYANNFRAPYLWWDFALGLSQAIGIAALWWPLVGQVVPA